jgi:hypothetical protein
MIMEKIQWLERKFNFDLPNGMLPFYLERLEGTITRLEKKVKNVPDKILSEKLNDKWSIKQNIGHLAELDEVSLKRIDEILKGISPISSAVFEVKQDYNSQSIDEVVRYFKNNRIKVNARFKTLSSQELQKSSIHPRLKTPITPLGLAWFHAEHDDHHIVRINEIIETLLK